MNVILSYVCTTHLVGNGISHTSLIDV